MRVSDELSAWFAQEGEHKLGDLLETFGERSFAIAFVILLGVPALPLPTGGVTHVFEAIAVLLALELIAGRDEIWLPRRMREVELAADGRFVTTLLKTIRRLERLSKPRLRFLFGRRLTNGLYGLLVAGLSIAAFVAPPFTGLDTLPALGAVVLSLGVLLEDAIVAAVGIVVGLVGVALIVLAGGAALEGVSRLF